MISIFCTSDNLFQTKIVQNTKQKQTIIVFLVNWQNSASISFKITCRNIVFLRFICMENKKNPPSSKKTWLLPTVHMNYSGWFLVNEVSHKSMIRQKTKHFQLQKVGNYYVIRQHHKLSHAFNEKKKTWYKKTRRSSNWFWHKI